MSQNPLEFVDDADDTDFVFKVQNGEEEDQQEDGDGQALVTTNPEAAEAEINIFMAIMLIGPWLDWWDDLLMGFIGGFLATGAPGFFLKFWLGVMTTLGQGLIFLGASVGSGIVGVWKNIAMAYRSAAFSKLRSHIDAHRDFQDFLHAYELNLLWHVKNLFSEQNASAYTQRLAQHPLIANIRQKIDIMKGTGSESTLQQVKTRYLVKSQFNHWFLISYGVCAAIVGTGGLVGFLLLTPNAMIGEFVKIPDWLFIVDISLATAFGLRAGYKEIKSQHAGYQGEWKVIEDLTAAELLTEARLQSCENAYIELSRIIEQNGAVQNQEFAPSTWVPERPLLSVSDFKKQEESAGTYVRQGVFSLGGGGGAALFPIKPKQRRNLFRRRVDEAHQAEEGREMDLRSTRAGWYSNETRTWSLENSQRDTGAAADNTGVDHVEEFEGAGLF